MYIMSMANPPPPSYPWQKNLQLYKREKGKINGKLEFQQLSSLPFTA